MRITWASLDLNTREALGMVWKGRNIFTGKSWRLCSGILIFACALTLATCSAHAAAKTFLANDYGAKGEWFDAEHGLDPEDDRCRGEFGRYGDLQTGYVSDWLSLPEIRDQVGCRGRGDPDRFAEAGRLPYAAYAHRRDRDGMAVGPH